MEINNELDKPPPTERKRSISNIDIPMEIECIITQDGEQAVQCNCLKKAAELDHHECVKKALSEIALEKDTFTRAIHQDLLYIAAEHDCYKTAEVLLDKGFKANAKAQYAKKSSVSALHVASDNLSVTLMKLLLDRGADINAKDELGQSCLHYIARNGKYEDAFGSKLKDVKDGKEKGMECLKLLLDNEKLLINDEDKEGRTALHHAAIHRNGDYVVELIER